MYEKYKASLERKHFNLGASQGIKERQQYLNSSKEHIQVCKTMNMKKGNIAMHTTRNTDKSSMYKTHFQWNTPKFDI
jgi:hypothetical protein